jgi:hypothetical protein
MTKKNLTLPPTSVPQKNKAKAKKLARDAEKEAIHWSAVIKELALRPPVAGGLVGVGKFFLQPSWRTFTEANL